MAAPLMAHPPNDVKVITGMGQLKGTIAFLNGPVVVWSGNITTIPTQIEAYSTISINPDDYAVLFVGI